MPPPETITLLTLNLEISRKIDSPVNDEIVAQASLKFNFSNGIKEKFKIKTLRD